MLQSEKFIVVISACPLVDLVLLSRHVILNHIETKEKESFHYGGHVAGHAYLCMAKQDKVK